MANTRSTNTSEEVDKLEADLARLRLFNTDEPSIQYPSYYSQESDGQEGLNLLDEPLHTHNTNNTHFYEKQRRKTKKTQKPTKNVKSEKNDAFYDEDEVQSSDEDDDVLEEEIHYPHQCSYCGIHSSDCVVKCNLSTCQKWFCNSTHGTSGSHIVNHLVKNKHKEVILHTDSPLGETTLECYHCGSKNVFLLGFIHSSQEGVVMLICREPCLTSNALREYNWDLNQWQPLIEDRMFLNWLVRYPNNEERKRAKNVSMKEIMMLEDQWKIDPNATLDDAKKNVCTKEPKPVQLKYENAVDYHNIFAPLVSIEAKYHKKMAEGRKQENVTLRWDIGLNYKHYAYFFFRKDEGELRLVISDELKLSHTNINGKEWQCTGQIARMSNTEEIALELHVPANSNGPWDKDITTGFTVELVWKSTPFLRCISALRTFVSSDTSVSGYLYHKLLGHSVEDQFIKTPLPHQYSAPNLGQLNHSQVQAVNRALCSPLCLIQGPPGTGKTLCSATIVYHLSKMSNYNEGSTHTHTHTRGGSGNSGGNQILVVSPSNVAVDQLAERIHRTGLKVVRVCAKSRELLPSSIDFLSLHNQILQVRTENGEKLRKLIKLKEEIGELSMEDGKLLKSLRYSIEYQLLQFADVICTTCVGAGDPRLRGFRFKQVLIDEATQATEPECLVPIVLGARQIILVGDHCQLPPIVLSKDASKKGLMQSMFERLVFLDVRPIRLEVQYRMHPCLSEFPSASFYDGSLQNGVTLAERTYTQLDFPFPNKSMPMFFYNSTGQEEVSASGTSYLNRTEASNIEKLVTYLLRGGLTASQIGIITPYDGQRSYISSLFQRQTTLNQTVYQEIEIASVDAFQGREKDFILLSCVRSNQNLGIGFLSDPRRLNVALTRAKYGLIVCGNAKVLASSIIHFQHTIWCNLLGHFKKYNLVVEGPLSNLKISNLHFSMPIKPISRYHTVTPISLSFEELQEYDRTFDIKKSTEIQNNFEFDEQKNFKKFNKNYKKTKKGNFDDDESLLDQTYISPDMVSQMKT